MRRYAILALAFLAAPAMAEDAPDLQVEEAVILETSPVARAAAGYVIVENGSDRPYTLTGIESPFTAAELHETVAGADGVMRMEPRDGFEIAPGETLELTRGGKHIMFMGLGDQLSAGDSVDTVLVFGEEARLPITFRVVPAGEMSPDGHDHGDMDDM